MDAEVMAGMAVLMIRLEGFGPGVPLAVVRVAVENEVSVVDEAYSEKVEEASLAVEDSKDGTAVAEEDSTSAVLLLWLPAELVEMVSTALLLPVSLDDSAALVVEDSSSVALLWLSTELVEEVSTTLLLPVSLADSAELVAEGWTVGDEDPSVVEDSDSEMEDAVAVVEEDSDSVVEEAVSEVVKDSALEGAELLAMVSLDDSA